jgi:hypothetical protein
MSVGQTMEAVSIFARMKKVLLRATAKKVTNWMMMDNDAEILMNVRLILEIAVTNVRTHKEVSSVPVHQGTS